MTVQLIDGARVDPRNGPDARRRSTQHLRLSARRCGVPLYPVILQRTPYGITPRLGAGDDEPHQRLAARCRRTARKVVSSGGGARSFATDTPRSTRTVAVGSDPEGEDHATATTRTHGFDTLEWIADPTVDERQPSGSPDPRPERRPCSPPPHSGTRACGRSSRRSAVRASTTTSSTKAQSIEMERLWMWVARTTSGASLVHPSRIGHGSVRPRPGGARAGGGRGTGRPAMRRSDARAAHLSAVPSDRPSGCTSPSSGTPTSRYGSRTSTRSSATPRWTPSVRETRLPRGRSTFRDFTSRRGSTSSIRALDRGVPRDPGARRQSATVDRPRTTTSSSTRASSGLVTRTSNGSTTG